MAASGSAVLAGAAAGGLPLELDGRGVSGVRAPGVSDLVLDEALWIAAGLLQAHAKRGG